MSPVRFAMRANIRGPDLLIVVEREYKIGPTVTRQSAMRTGLTFERPSNPKKRGQHPTRAGARPRSHAALKEMVRSSGPASPCSRRSAITRSASACTFDRAASSLSP